MVAGCATVTAPFRDVDERWKNYKNWTQVNDEPTSGASPGMGATHKGPTGYRLVFVNDVGKDVLLGDGPYQYPKGTVVVKEQYDTLAAAKAGSDPQVMVSLKVSTASGGADDWQWAEGLKATASDNAFCSGCHGLPLAQDFVFSNETFKDLQEKSL